MNKMNMKSFSATGHQTNSMCCVIINNGNSGCHKCLIIFVYSFIRSNLNIMLMLCPKDLITFISRIKVHIPCQILDTLLLVCIKICITFISIAMVWFHQGKMVQGCLKLDMSLEQYAVITYKRVAQGQVPNLYAQQHACFLLFLISSNWCVCVCACMRYLLVAFYF